VRNWFQSLLFKRNLYRYTMACLAVAYAANNAFLALLSMCAFMLAFSASWAGVFWVGLDWIPLFTDVIILQSKHGSIDNS
jgi:hypothetical protein